jgi:hypothetical protein
MKATLVFSLLLGASLQAAAEEDAFVPPAPYPVERYAPGWQKNPFTLKTAPVAVAKESFARDLALGGISKIGSETKVVLVNVKTRERKTYQNNEAGADGIRVLEVRPATSHRDSFVKVESGGEQAEIRYDESFLKQLAGSQAHMSGIRPPAQGNPAQPGAAGMPFQQPSPGNPAPPGMPTARATSPAQGGAPAAGAPVRTAPPGFAQIGIPPGANIPTPQRRRLLTAPAPAQR